VHQLIRVAPGDAGDGAVEDDQALELAPGRDEDAVDFRRHGRGQRGLRARQRGLTQPVADELQVGADHRPFYTAAGEGFAAGIQHRRHCGRDSTPHFGRRGKGAEFLES
jgi:hypothetical protein